MPTPPPSDFSLILGGPLFRLLRRARLTGNALELLHRRILVLVSIAWLPLLLLSILEGRAWGRSVTIPFLHDADTHARLLVALPMLIMAEVIVHQRLRLVLVQFIETDLIPEASRDGFLGAIESARRWRDSVLAEALLIALVYVGGVGFLWRRHVALGVATWYGVETDGLLQPSRAGWWLGCVSLPLLQFLLLRWYWRIFLWARLLWQVSRLDLHLVPAHPDRSGGLGFLTITGHAFKPLLLAQGTMVAGAMANRIFFMGNSLPDFKVEIVGLVVAMLLIILGPLLVFARPLANLKRTGLCDYGALAHRYVAEFDRKWLRGGAGPAEPLLGSADVQSLADLSNSFRVVEEMRPIPFTLRTVVQLGVVSLIPVAPLVLTMVSPQVLLQRILKIVF
ncbi:MAG: hypothetical protein ACREAA_19495 [Candidatus Polarisedimenticolia bacterium]